VILSASNLPSFASFIDNENNIGLLNFSPEESDQGVYEIQLSATDGIDNDTDIFSLTVSDNDNPEFVEVIDQTITEGFSSEIEVMASDLQGNSSLTLSLDNNPAFVSLTDNGAGNGLLSINPSLGDAGFYDNITIVAEDGGGGVAYEKFNVFVNNADLNNYKIYLNFSHANISAPNPWNNTGEYNINNRILSNVLDEEGNEKDITISLFDEGSNGWSNSTGSALNSAGIYPLEVMSTQYWLWQSSVNVTIATETVLSGKSACTNLSTE